MQLGSWFYMAPEQQEDPHEATTSSDIYALGVTWLEMLSGNLPSPHAVAAGQYPKPCGNDDVCNIIRRMVLYVQAERPSLAEIRAVVTNCM
jgi:serine/threonine protein kinase